MQNLAGSLQADRFIEKELTRARIDIVDHGKRLGGEVYTDLTGALNHNGVVVFTFSRAWYYWVVEGQVPLSLAEELYADPVGKDDIRVAGYAGNAPPKEWVVYYDSVGKTLVNKDQEAEFLKFSHLPGVMAKKETIHFVDSPADEAAFAFVESYHIDSEVGLRIFVDSLRQNGLVDPLPA